MEHLGKIYILHGWSYTTEKWPLFLEGLKNLGFEPVLLKIPGLTAPIDRVWTLEDYVAWLADVLKNEERPATLLGHSNGGRISIAFAAAHPEKVAQLVLIGSAGVYHNDPVIRSKRAVFGALAKAGRRLQNVPLVRKVFYKLVGERDYRDADPIMRETMRNLITADLAPKMPGIAVPALLIWGEHDASTPLSDGRLMHEKLPRSELSVISGARHSPQFTHVAETIDSIKKYYDKKSI